MTTRAAAAPRVAVGCPPLDALHAAVRNAESGRARVGLEQGSVPTASQTFSSDEPFGIAGLRIEIACAGDKVDRDSNPACAREQRCHDRASCAREASGRTTASRKA